MLLKKNRLPVLFPFLLLFLHGCAQGNYQEIKGKNVTYKVFEIRPIDAKILPEGYHDIYQIAVIDGLNYRHPDLAEASYFACGNYGAACGKIAAGRKAFIISGLGNANVEPGEMIAWPVGTKKIISGTPHLSFNHALATNKSLILTPATEKKPAQAELTLKKQCNARVFKFHGKIPIANTKGMITLPDSAKASWVEVKADCWEPQDYQDFILSEKEKIIEAGKKVEQKAKHNEFRKQQAEKSALRKQTELENLEKRWQVVNTNAEKAITEMDQTQISALSTLEQKLNPRLGALMQAARITKIQIEFKCLTYGWTQNNKWGQGYKPCIASGESLQVIFDSGENREFQGTTYLPLPQYYKTFRTLYRTPGNFLKVVTSPEPDYNPAAAERTIRKLIEYLAKNVADGPDRKKWDLPNLESIYVNP